MEEQELEEQVREVNSVYYSVFGLSGLQFFLPGQRARSRSQSFQKYFSRFLLFVIHPTYLASQTYYVFMGGGEISHYILNSSIFLNASNGFIKAMYFVLYARELERLMLPVMKLQSVQADSQYSLGELVKTSRWLSRASYWYNMLAYLVMWFWIAVPFVQSDLVKGWLGMAATGKAHKPLPSIYPFDYQSYPGLHIVFTFEVFMCMSGLTYLVPVDMFFIAVSLMYSTQVRITCRAIRHHLHANLAELLAEHNTLLGITKAMSQLLSLILGVQLLTSVISICSNILQLSIEGIGPQDTMLEYVMLQLRYYTYLACAVAQLLAYCIVSSQMQEANKSIGVAMYEAGWEEGDKQTRLVTQQVMVRSGKAVLMSAMGLVRIDMSTFIDVLRLSYSYFTFLRKFHVD